jgi:hypothetical protein
MKNVNWEISHPFRVEWLSKTEVDFCHVGHLKNPYNEGLPVLVGKDGQEMEEECGRGLLDEMFTIAWAKYERRHLPSNRRELRERDKKGGEEDVKREEGEVIEYNERGRRV